VTLHFSSRDTEHSNVVALRTNLVTKLRSKPRRDVANRASGVSIEEKDEHATP
jgi:hypothetical protein